MLRAWITGSFKATASPPYWGLRDYGHDGQIGLESTPEAYVARMVEVFREVRRVLRDDGTCWVNLGDSYAATTKQTGRNDNGQRASAPAEWNCRYEYDRTKIRMGGSLKPKDLVGIPWRVAFALQADGWWLRQDIIWHKPNPMPESVRDRCTKAHEYVFLMTKSERYYYDAEAISEPASQSSGWAKQRKNGTDTWKYGKAAGGDPNSTNGVGGTLALGSTRNRRSVWTITTKPYSGAHFAVMPPDLVEPCIKAGCPEQCCPVCGAGYERIVEQKKGDTEASDRPKRTAGMSSKTSTLSLSGNGSKEWAERGGKRLTLGWKPACDCATTGTIPGTVLDPFAGSGTTLAVAAELGRNGIGCELNPEYIKLAEERIAKVKAKSPLFVA
jgi:DNA modification methylase